MCGTPENPNQEGLSAKQQKQCQFTYPPPFQMQGAQGLRSLEAQASDPLKAQASEMEQHLDTCWNLEVQASGMEQHLDTCWNLLMPTPFPPANWMQTAGTFPPHLCVRTIQLLRAILGAPLRCLTCFDNLLHTNLPSCLPNTRFFFDNLLPISLPSCLLNTRLF